MQGLIDAEVAEAPEIKVLGVLGRRLEDDLELVIVLKAVGILAVAPVGGPPRWLNVGRLPRPRTKRAQRRRRVEGAGAHFHVIGLKDRAPLFGPEALQLEDQMLEAGFRGGGTHHGTGGDFAAVQRTYCPPKWRSSRPDAPPVHALWGHSSRGHSRGPDAAVNSPQTAQRTMSSTAAGALVGPEVLGLRRLPDPPSRRTREKAYQTANTTSAVNKSLVRLNPSIRPLYGRRRGRGQADPQTRSPSAGFAWPRSGVGVRLLYPLRFLA